MEQLRKLILLEEFKKCLPEKVVTYLNEQKQSKITDAAVLADEFTSTHNTAFLSSTRHDYVADTQKRVKPSTTVRRRSLVSSGVRD